MATLYDVLGVEPQAPPEVVRRAYLDRARALHPDRAAGRPSAEAASTARRMQDVNEAWRVLGDPVRRAAYDRSLVPAAPPPAAAEVDDLDRVYRSPVAEPGDLGVSIVRALPWVAVVVVLGAIFVFTAFAAGGGDTRDGAERLEGRCISASAPGSVQAVPCDGPNEGRVVLVADRSSHCPPGTASRPFAGSRFLCLDRRGP